MLNLFVHYKLNEMPLLDLISNNYIQMNKLIISCLLTNITNLFKGE